MNNLYIKQIITTKDQEVERLVAVKWSFFKYIKNIGKDEFGLWNFNFALGRHEVYEKFSIPKGSNFNLLELAILNLDRFMLLSTYEDFRQFTKIRIRNFNQVFQYIEVDK